MNFDISTIGSIATLAVDVLKKVTGAAPGIIAQAKEYAQKAKDLIAEIKANVGDLLGGGVMSQEQFVAACDEADQRIDDAIKEAEAVELPGQH